MRIVPFSALAVLAACGGSGVVPITTVPLSAKGFATDGEVFEGSYNFTVPDVVRILGEDEDLRQESAGDITVRGTVQSGPITVTYDGKTYVLARSAMDLSSASFIDGEDEVSFFSIVRGSDYAVAVTLFSYVESALNTGGFVIGYDTDPRDVAQITGNATFEGLMSADLRNGFQLATGTGDFILVADFNRNTVSGSGLLVDDNLDVADFNFDPVAIRFEPAAIQENGFSGDVSVSAGDINGTLADAAYQGRFFGPNAESVGGQITGRIILDNGGRNTFVDGVFLADR